MKVFLWTFLILGLFEAGGSAAYLLTGVWPMRTRSGIFVNALVWAGVSFWAAYLLIGKTS